jgi:hypothetical protein
VDPANPVEEGFIMLLQDVEDVRVHGDHAYIANSYGGMAVVNIADPSSPVLVGSVDLTGNSRSIDIYDDYAFVGADWGGLFVVDISNPAEPVQLHRLNTRGKVWNVIVDNDRVYAADYDCGIAVIEFSTSAVSDIRKGDAVMSVFPVPSIDAVTLHMQLARTSELMITISDQLGRPVRMFRQAILEPGEFDFAWDGRDENGRVMEPGIYEIMISDTGEIIGTGRVLLIR